MAKYGGYEKGDGTKILKLLGYYFQWWIVHNMWLDTNVIVGNYIPLRNAEMDFLKIDAANRHNGFQLEGYLPSKFLR